MVRSNDHRKKSKAPAAPWRREVDSTDLLAGVRAEMAVVRQRLIDLAEPTPLPFELVDPMPPQRLRQLKGRITVVAGWGERNLEG